MLRRYGVMSQPRGACGRSPARARSAPASCCWTAPAQGLGGRLRGWRDGAGLERREVDGAAAARHLRPRGAGAAPPAARLSVSHRRLDARASAARALGRRRGAGGGARAAAVAASAAPPACRAASPRKRRCVAARSQRADLDGGDPRQRRASGMNLTWVASRLRATSRAFSAPGRSKPACPGGVADMPDDRLGDVLEAPAGDPRPHVEVDVLVEGEVALVVAAELDRTARGAAGRRRRRRRRPRGAAGCPAAAPPPPRARAPGRRRVSAWPAL